MPGAVISLCARPAGRCPGDRWPDPGLVDHRPARCRRLAGRDQDGGAQGAVVQQVRAECDRMDALSWRDSRPQAGSPAAGKLSIRPKKAGCQGTRARCWPRWPSAGTPLTPPSDQAHHTDEHNEQVHGVAREEQHDLCPRGIVLGRRRPRREEHERLYACIKRGCRHHHPAGEAITAGRRKPRRTVPTRQHDGGEGEMTRLPAAGRVSVLDPTLVRAAVSMAIGKWLWPHVGTFSWPRTQARALGCANRPFSADVDTPAVAS
jgi:hypothetical protein